MPPIAPAGSSSNRALPRRRRPRSLLLAPVVAAALALGLTACGSDDTGATAGASAGVAEWSYADGSGATITLPAMPKRIVATSGMYFALHDLGIDPVGVLGQKPAAGDASWKGVDTDKLQWFGTADGVNVEALAAAHPDAVIAEYDKPNQAYWGYGDDRKGQANTKEFTKLIGFDITGTVPEIFDRVSTLASDLGADPASASTTALKQKFEQASDRVKADAAAKPGLTVARIGADKSGMSFGCASGQNDIAYWKQLGVGVQEGLGCNNAPGSSSYWGTVVSWEKVSDYPADVLIDNSFGIAATRKLATSNAAFAALPAIKAGQLAQIETFPALSYSQYIANLDALASAMEASKVVTR